MKQALEIGTKMSGAKFALPFELVTRTLAIIGIRGSGKTSAATVIAEEMCEGGLPWVALDPVGVWWGLRCNSDGTPGGYPAVIIGGEHADIPLEKHMGPRLAETVLQENAACIVDLSGESKNTWRFFVTEFCDRLMELRPAVPRMIFIEEAPEFVPQRPMGEQKRSLAAVDRVSRLGRNNGYGCAPISQRFATVNKDVLTQCENLLAFRSIGKPDRNAARDWIAECVGATDSEKKAEKFLDSLTSLPDGTAWFWSPQWLGEFLQIRVRRRKTYHPGETRTLGQAPKQVALSDVRDFVDRFQQLLKAERAKPKPSEHAAKPAVVPPLAGIFPPISRTAGEIVAQEEAARLRAQVADLHRQLGAAKSAVDAIRKVMEPQYRAMQKLFSELDAAPSGGIDGNVFEPWMKKLGAGPAKLIELLLERGGEATRVQLQTLSGYSERSMVNHISRLNSNNLITKDGSMIRLRVP